MSQSPEQNAMNLILKTTDPALMTVDFDAIAAAQKERRAQQDAAQEKLKPVETDPGWRDELAQLERWVPHTPTEKAVKQAAAAKEGENLNAVKEIENQIRNLREVLSNPHIQTHSGFDPNGEPKVSHSDGYTRGGFACGCDGCSILNNIQRAEHKLSQAREILRRDAKKFGAAIEGARAADKQRPRLLELQKREFEISKATKQHRGALPARPRMSGGLAADEIEMDTTGLHLAR